jgi:hypothetical protein
MTLKKYEYLLRDVPFKIKTDHANLLYLNVPPSSKVLRWKIAIQEYDFQVTHIPGKDNIVADAFSRLMDPIEEPMGHLLSLTRKAMSHPMESGEEDDSSEKIQNAANMSPLPEAAYRNIIRVHNAWMGHRGVDATCKLLHEQGVTWPKCENTSSNSFCSVRHARSPKSAAPATIHILLSHLLFSRMIASTSIHSMWEQKTNMGTNS